MYRVSTISWGYNMPKKSLLGNSPHILYTYLYDILDTLHWSQHTLLWSSPQKWNKVIIPGAARIYYLSQKKNKTQRKATDHTRRKASKTDQDSRNSSSGFRQSMWQDNPPSWIIFSSSIERDYLHRQPPNFAFSAKLNGNLSSIHRIEHGNNILQLWDLGD